MSNNRRYVIATVQVLGFDCSTAWKLLEEVLNLKKQDYERQGLALPKENANALEYMQRQGYIRTHHQRVRTIITKVFLPSILLVTSLSGCNSTDKRGVFPEMKGSLPARLIYNFK